MTNRNRSYRTTSGKFIFLHRLANVCLAKAKQVMDSESLEMDDGPDNMYVHNKHMM